MVLKAAVASSDGNMINCHFGKADSFYIYELNEDEFHFSEKRFTRPCCMSGTHDEADFERTARLLQDCSIIIVSKIGVGAGMFLESRGFTVYEAPFPITKVLRLITDHMKGSEA